MDANRFVFTGWYSVLILAQIVLGAAALDTGYGEVGTLLILSGTGMAIYRVVNNIKLRKAREAEELKQKRKMERKLEKERKKEQEQA